MVVDGARDELFAGAGFALDQDRRIGGSHHPYRIPDLAQAALGANDRFAFRFRRREVQNRFAHRGRCHRVPLFHPVFLFF
jgi:hypothetical protein